MKRFACALVVGMASVLATNAVSAVPDTKETQQKQTPAQVGKDVQRWIDQLGSDQFKDREQATQELRKLGKAALPGLKKALKHSDAEVRRRAQALITLIDPPPAPPPAKAGDGQVEVAAFVLALRLQAGPGVPAKPGGVQRTIEITEDPQGLTITVTQTKDGKEVKKEYKAKDAKELEQKYPEAYKIYKGSTDLLPDPNKSKK